MMRRLFSDKKCRIPLILNIAGIVFALIGWFLNELYLADKWFFGGSWLQLAGFILWFNGVFILIRALLKQQTD